MVIDVVPNDHDWWFFPAISGLEVHLEKVKKPKTELLYHFVNLNYYCEHRNIPSNYFTTNNMTPPSERRRRTISQLEVMWYECSNHVMIIGLLATTVEGYLVNIFYLILDNTLLWSISRLFQSFIFWFWSIMIKG